MKKYTVYYKRITNTPYTIGRSSNDEEQHTIVKADSIEDAHEQVKSQQKMYMDRTIRVISTEVEPLDN